LHSTNSDGGSRHETQGAEWLQQIHCSRTPRSVAASPGSSNTLVRSQLTTGPPPLVHKMMRVEAGVMKMYFIVCGARERVSNLDL
jgi:hypothetical protein